MKLLRNHKTIIKKIISYIVIIQVVFLFVNMYVILLRTFLDLYISQYIPIPFTDLRTVQPIVVDFQGRVYVIDLVYSTMQVFNVEGKFLYRVRTEFGFGYRGSSCLTIDYMGRIWLIGSYGGVSRVIDGKIYYVPAEKLKCAFSSEQFEGKELCKNYDTENIKLDKNGDLVITKANEYSSRHYSIVKPGEYLCPVKSKYGSYYGYFIDREGREWHTVNWLIPHITVKKDGKVIRRIYHLWWLYPFTIRNLIILFFVEAFAVMIAEKIKKKRTKTVDKE